MRPGLPSAARFQQDPPSDLPQLRCCAQLPEYTQLQVTCTTRFCARQNGFDTDGALCDQVEARAADGPADALAVQADPGPRLHRFRRGGGAGFNPAADHVAAGRERAAAADAGEPADRHGP
eukprot:117136-Rhodomonas_salina.1